MSAEFARLELAAVSTDEYHSVPKAGALCIRLCPRLNHIRKATVMLKVALRRSPGCAVLAMCTYNAAVGGMLLTTRPILLHMMVGQSHLL